jgi:hypothetical protein
MQDLYSSGESYAVKYRNRLHFAHLAIYNNMPQFSAASHIVLTERYWQAIVRMTSCIYSNYSEKCQFAAAVTGHKVDYYRSPLLKGRHRK